jgi:hypothetical protein
LIGNITLIARLTFTVIKGVVLATIPLSPPASEHPVIGDGVKAGDQRQLLIKS